MKQREGVKQENLGRSMVEMLGALAIIGVLSVGGIAGYKYGMERHQANQVLNEMNLASLQLAIQLQQGNNKGVQLALGEPFESGTLQSVPFGFAYMCGEGKDATKECAEQETRYQLAITNVPYGICQQLSENISNLQYYNDMEINNVWDGTCQKDSTNEIAVLFDVAETATVAANVGEETESTDYYYTSTDNYYSLSTDYAYSSSTDYYSNSGYYTETGIYSTSVGEPNACGASCKESEGKFCNAYSYACTANEAYDGECLTAANYTKQGSQSGLVASSIAINSWWSAESFCKALGKKMVSLEKLGCNTGIGACNTAKTEQMKADFKTDYHFVWTSSLAGTENACNAYSIRLSTGEINSVGRIYAYSEALCEDECTTAADCNEGQACVNGACSDSCTADTQCRSEEHCEGDKCVKNCTSSNECDGLGCNTKNGRCEPCTNTDSLCNGTNKVCNEDNGQCVACMSNDDCTTTAAPVCDESTRTCAKCATNPQCGDSVYDHCITVSGTTQGQCKKCTSSSPYFNGTTCTSCPSGTVWSEAKGVCEEAAGQENQPCKADLTCDEGLYCKTSGSSCSADTTTGTCKLATVATSGTVNGRTMYVSNETMNYWSAERFCEALGKKRVSRTSIGCSGWTSSWYCTSNSDYAGGSTSSDIVKELKELYNNSNATWAWLDDDYGNSCLAYYVSLGSGDVYYNSRSNRSCQALCE